MFLYRNVFLQVFVHTHINIDDSCNCSEQRALISINRCVLTISLAAQRLTVWHCLYHQLSPGMSHSCWLTSNLHIAVLHVRGYIVQSNDLGIIVIYVMACSVCPHAQLILLTNSCRVGVRSSAGNLRVPHHSIRYAIVGSRYP